MPRLLSTLLLTLGIAASASAVLMDWTFVGTPGNACDTQPNGCFGAVGYDYRIGTFEVTNAQYTEFLNAVADTDTHALYSYSMSLQYGGIAIGGSEGSYVYTAIPGREDKPVNHVSFYDALRFANWMHNGQPSGAQDASTTEDGAYTITLQGIGNNTITRNAGAIFALPSEDEWYKAAYYEASSLSYFAYPAGSDTAPECSEPTATPNCANCGLPVALNVTDVGSYTGSASPYGTFDQGGNVFEWNEGISDEAYRVIRGGSAFDSGYRIPMGAAERYASYPTTEIYNIGIRLVPEPSTNLLQMTGLLALLGVVRLRRMRARRAS